MNTRMILGGKTTPIFGLTPKSGHLGFLKVVTEPQEDLCAKAIALQVWSWGRDARLRASLRSFGGWINLHLPSLKLTVHP